MLFAGSTRRCSPSVNGSGDPQPSHWLSSWEHHSGYLRMETSDPVRPSTFWNRWLIPLSSLSQCRTVNQYCQRIIFLCVYLSVLLSLLKSKWRIAHFINMFILEGIYRYSTEVSILNSKQLVNRSDNRSVRNGKGYGSNGTERKDESNPSNKVVVIVISTQKKTRGRS